MRTVSFSDARVQDVLNRWFVCCYTNTKGDPSAGASLSHAPNDPPGLCGRGAGRQNVQTFFLTSNQEIFHVASGYLDPEDLLAEIEFARRLHQAMLTGPPPDRRRRFVATAHGEFLKKTGFTNNQIRSGGNQMSDFMLSMPNPQDMGFDFNNMFGGSMFGRAARGAPDGTRRGGNFFDEISQGRTLKDHQFVMRNPLLTRRAFEQRPQELVGHHKSFFGSAGGPHTRMLERQRAVNRR